MLRLFLALMLVTETALAAPEALLDPIPEKIQMGDIVVAVENFVRVPKSEDSSTQNNTRTEKNKAAA